MRQTPDKFFTLDTDSGVVKIADNVCGGTFANVTKASILVQAKDKGEPALATEKNALMELAFTEFNTNGPAFKETFTARTLVDTTPKGTVVAQLVATDAHNVNCEASKIVFSIKKDTNPKDKFVIDSKTGIIKTNDKVVKNEVTTLTVVATGAYPPFTCFCYL